MSTTQPQAGFRGSILPPQCIGYPCVAQADYDDKKMKSGDEGVVTGVSPNGKWANVMFTNPYKGGAVVVPSSHIMVGTVRKFGQYKMMNANPATTTSISRQPSIPPASVLGLTITSLVDAFRTLNVAVLPHGMKLKLEDAPTLAMLKWKLQSMVIPQARTVLANPDFTLADLQTLPRIQTLPDGQGIYLIIMDNEVYIGTTAASFENRHDKGHVMDMNSPKKTDNPRIKALQKAGSFTMHVVAEFEQAISAELQALAEQIFICLLQTYCSWIFYDNRQNLLLEEAIAEMVGGNHIMVYQAAEISRVAEDCFARTGWKGFVKRPGSGVRDGLNYQSPFSTTGYVRTLWTKLVLSAQKRILFRRGYYRAQNYASSSGSSLVVGNFKENTITFRTQPRPEIGLTSDTPVLMVVEIMIGGDAHPQPWSRLPEIGPWKDWTTARSIGIRIEWKDDATGKWWTQNVFSGYLDRATATSPCGIPRHYLQAMAMWRFFMQYEKASYHDYEERYHLGVIALREIQVNHVQQEVRVRDSPRQSRKIRVEPMLSDEEIKQQMRQRGAQLVHTRPADNDNSQFTIRDRRCDTCRFLDMKPQNQPCVQLGNTGRCQACFMIGHFCSWTNSVGHARSSFAFSDVNRALAPFPNSMCDTDPRPLERRDTVETVCSD